MVNRLSGEPSSQLHERHDADDFETKTQDKLRSHGGLAGPRVSLNEEHQDKLRGYTDTLTK